MNNREVNSKVREIPEVDAAPGHDVAIFTNNDDKEANLHLKPAYALGFRSCGRTVVDFTCENVVIYPVAHHLTLYNLENHSMDFFHNVKHIKSVQSFQLSPNRELLVVAEVFQQWTNTLGQGTATSAATASPSTGLSTANSPPKGSHVALQSQHREQEARALSIYKIGTKVRLRSIPLQPNSNVVSCSFSADNKFLAILEDAPAHTVTYWKVSNAKLVASCKCPSRGSRIHISPTNANFISVSGPTTLKYWVWTNNDLKISNFLPQLKDQEHFADHTWLKEHMISISERGLLLCFRITLDGCSADLTHSSRCHQPSHVRMECIAAHGKGFVLGGSAGFFSIYESSDDTKDPFPFVRSVSVGDVAFDCITVSPNSETIVACSKSRELITFSMSAIDTEQEDRIDYRELIRHGHQLGAVLQVDVCIQRPILVTCGTDKTVRVWNFELLHYELLHNCPEEPITVAVHPSGFQLVVAFKERVRVYQLLQESLRQVKELAIKACRFVRYSHGGQLFACASGLTVTTFRSYTFEAVHTFSGHIGAVRCLSWSRDDIYLFSAAHDGAIYRWDISTGSRSDEMQHVVKQCQYAAFVVDRNDPSVAVAAGSDGKVREITSVEETKSFDLPRGTIITSMALMKDCKRLFAGTKGGSVLVYPWPLSNKNVAEYFAHAEGILQIRITEDNEQLITCGEDGSVNIFKILNGGLQHQGSKMAQDETKGSRLSYSISRPTSSSTLERRKVGVAYTDAVLVSRDDLEERRAEILEWQQRHDQVKADVEFALHRKENEWINRLHVLKEGSEHLVVQERVRYEELEARHQLSTRKHVEELTQLEAHHVKMTQELENQYERKLAQEVARYDALSEMLEQTRQRCEALVETQDSQNRGTLHAERKAAYTRAKEQNEVIKRLHEDLKYNHAKFEEVLHQEEGDYEQELQKLRVEFASQLEVERQNTAVKQGQVSAANTKLESLRKKMQELKASSHARDVLLSTERAKLTRLETTLANYERHFETCRVSNHDKEKTINGLKSDNRVLENFRSVLSHRIDGLETEKTPMQEHLHVLEAKIREMQNELADEFRIKAEIQQDVENKDAKIRTLLHEVKALRQNSLKKEYSVGEMTREFTRLTQLTNYKDLESAVKDAYKVYVMGETLHKKPPRAILTGSNSTPSIMASTSTNVPNSPGGGGFYSPAKHNTSLQSKVKNTQQKQPSFSAAALLSVASSISDEALGYDCKQSVDESVKQMEYMSRTIQTLRTALDHAKAQTDRVRRDSVADGSILIEECNKLRKENKLLQIQIRDLKRDLYLVGGPATSSEGEGAALSNSARMLQRLSSPHSYSRPVSPSQEPQTLDLTLDATTVGVPGSGGSVTLVPLHTGRATPSKQQRRQRTPSSPSPSRNNSSSGMLLPFARVERRQQNAIRADELTAVVEKQKRDIQRLQTQVQLLLSGAADVPLSQPVRMIPLSPSTSSLSLDSSDPPRGGMTVSRIGTLRPLVSSQSTSSLQSSFVLAPADFPSLDDDTQPKSSSDETEPPR